MEEIQKLYNKHPKINDENFDEIKSVITTFLEKSCQRTGIDPGDWHISYWLKDVMKKSAEKKDLSLVSKLSRFEDITISALIYDILKNPTEELVDFLLDIKKANLLGWTFRGNEYFNDCVDLKKLPPNTTRKIINFCDIEENQITRHFFDYSMKSFDNNELEDILLDLYFKNSYYPDKNQAPPKKNEFIAHRFHRTDSQFALLLNHIEFTQYSEKEYCKVYEVKTMPFHVLTQEDVNEIFENKQFKYQPDSYRPDEYLQYEPKKELFLERQKMMLEREKLTVGQSFEGNEYFQKLIKKNNDNVGAFLDIVRIHCHFEVPDLTDKANAYFSLVDSAIETSKSKFNQVVWQNTNLEELVKLNEKFISKIIVRLKDSFDLAEFKENKNEYLLTNQKEFLNDILVATRKVYSFINYMEASNEEEIKIKEAKKSKI